MAYRLANSGRHRRTATAFPLVPPADPGHRQCRLASRPRSNCATTRADYVKLENAIVQSLIRNASSQSAHHQRGDLVVPRQRPACISVDVDRVEGTRPLKASIGDGVLRRSASLPRFGLRQPLYASSARTFMVVVQAGSAIPSCAPRTSPNLWVRNIAGKHDPARHAGRASHDAADRRWVSLYNLYPSATVIGVADARPFGSGETMELMDQVANAVIAAEHRRWNGPACRIRRTWSAIR